MKKLFFTLFLILLTLFMCISASAASIFDYADIIYDESYVTATSLELEQKYGFSLKVFTIIGSPDWQDIIHHCSGDPDRYAVLVISTNADGSYKDHSVYADDETLFVFNDKVCGDIEKMLELRLLSGYYDNAVLSYFSYCDEFIESALENNKKKANAKQLNEKYYQHFTLFVGFGISLAVGLIAACSAVFMHKKKLKTVHRAKDAFLYIDSEYLQISSTKEEVDDIFEFLFL